MSAWGGASKKVAITLFLVVPIVAITLISLRHNRHKVIVHPAVARAEGRHARPESYAFHGSGKMGETRVPFRMHCGGGIVIKARINEKPVDCIVDTGSPGILWASWLHFTERRTGLRMSVSDAGDNTNATQEAMLDHVQIGGFELRDTPSYAVEEGHSHLAALPVLGNSAFAHTVMTIDYARQELILQPSVANIVPSGVASSSHPIDFRWRKPGVRGWSGVPCIRGRVMSLPTDISIDTGWTEEDTDLTRSLYDRHLPQIQAGHVGVHKEMTHFIFGKSESISISHISGSVGGIFWAGPAVTSGSPRLAAQAVLGRSFLRNFRTTIDYPQRKIWLDRIQD